MQQFNFPTTLLYGEGSLAEGIKRLSSLNFKKPLIVTDKTLVEIGLIKKLEAELEKNNIPFAIYDGTHPNPVEDDCVEGAKVFKDNQCDSVIAIGGGSPMDAAKGIMVLATHDGPLDKYDDAKGGDKYITKPLPPLIAIATTAGTGSEVGRSGVIIVNSTKDKTIIFHPTMLPKLAILEPTLIAGLPPHITAATGLDALTHSLEAYFASGFHPMCDGIALEGMRLVLENLYRTFTDGNNLEARSKMLLASSMGATAFQKGLGMIHSIAHPLSSVCGLHHGLANAIMLPKCVQFLEESDLNPDQRRRIDNVIALFNSFGHTGTSLADVIETYISEFKIEFGLKNYGVTDDQIDILADKAFLDVCHGTNMIPVTTADFKKVITKAM